MTLSQCIDCQAARENGGTATSYEPRYLSRIQMHEDIPRRIKATPFSMCAHPSTPEEVAYNASLNELFDAGDLQTLRNMHRMAMASYRGLR